MRHLYKGPRKRTVAPQAFSERASCRCCGKEGNRQISYLQYMMPHFLLTPPPLFRHKIWQRGSNSSIFGQCGGCHVPATLRDPSTNNKPYAGGNIKQSNVCWIPTLELSSYLRTTHVLRLPTTKLWSWGNLFMRLVLPLAKRIRMLYGIRS